MYSVFDLGLSRDARKESGGIQRVISLAYNRLCILGDRKSDRKIYSFCFWRNSHVAYNTGEMKSGSIIVEEQTAAR